WPGERGGGWPRGTKPPRPCPGDPESRTARCWTTRSADLAPNTPCSSAIGSTPTSLERSTPAWTACWCSPDPIQLRGRSGSKGAEELVSARPGERPTFVGNDLRALLRPPLALGQSEAEFRCGAATASATDGHSKNPP